MASPTRVVVGAALVSTPVLAWAPRVAADGTTYNVTHLSQRMPIGINNQGQVGLGLGYASP